MKTFLLSVFSWLLLTTACNNRESQQTSGKMLPDSLQQVQQQSNASGYYNNNDPAGDTNADKQDIDPAKVARAAKDSKSLVQVAILLDTSNSMDGLIDQARSQLWKMVGDLALLRNKDGLAPDIEIALYEYGNDRLTQKSGYVRRVVPFTTDLDLISEQLFALSTYGGSEYCGQVILTSVEELDWNPSFDMLKIIFIAGNEEYTQGPVHYMTACKMALAKGININTIFCGSNKEGIATKWKDGADCADGKYLNIDQNQAVAHIDAPQDAEIIALNQRLNDTYVGYGISGKKRKELQAMEDMNASKYGSANAAQRAATKASASYKNDSWDMVDAMESRSLELDKIQEEDLPDEMKAMKLDERKAYLEKKSAERKEIQKQINKLEAERRVYIAQERSKMSAASKENTLDDAILQTIEYHAKVKNYSFQK